MKKLIIQGKSYSILTTCDDVKLKQQLDFDGLAKENSDYISLAVVAGYTGSSIDEIKRLHINDIETLLSGLSLVSIVS